MMVHTYLFVRRHIHYTTHTHAHTQTRTHAQRAILTLSFMASTSIKFCRMTCSLKKLTILSWLKKHAVCMGVWPNTWGTGHSNPALNHYLPTHQQVTVFTKIQKRV